MINKENIIITLLAWQQRLEENRKNEEKVWSEIASYIRPERNSFTGKAVSDVAKNIFDSTAIIASEFLVSSLWSMVSSSSNDWFKIQPKKFNLLADKNIKEWFEQVNHIMKKDLLSVESGFYHKSYEFYSDLVSFGTSIFYVGENIDNGLVEYSCKNLSNCYLDYGENNKVNIIFRKIYLFPEIAIKHFGINNVSDVLRKDYESGKSVKHLFIHVVIPKEYVNSADSDLKNMNYLSYYIEKNTQTLVAESGYNEFPYIVARWFTSPNSIYGDSPSMLVLPDIKMLNAICKTMLVALQKQVDPPILAPNEASVQGIKTNPGGVIYGGIDPITGNQLFRPLVSNLDLSGVTALEEQKRHAIKEAFHFSLLLSSYAKNATATEVLSVNEQRMQVLGSKISRIQTEFLYPLLIRQYKVMLRLNKFPKPPANLNVNNVEVEFYGVWNRYQKLLESIGLNKLVSIISNISHLYPQISNTVNWEEVLHIFSEGNGVPSKIFKV